MNSYVRSTRKHPLGLKPEKPLSGFESINRYWDKENGLFAAKILPGEFYVTTKNELVTTVLGSCVSACIRDTKLGIGGMNHFMLPITKSDSSDWGGVSRSARYGNYAMEHLINEIFKQGGQRHNLEIKIFGGGKVLSQNTDIGASNIEFVRQYIQSEGLKLVAEDVGDVFPRKVNYFPDMGLVRVKKLRSMQNDTVLVREQRYMHELEETPVEGSVELFD
jgi:chemotaxis protein CheD